jgi:polyribonucleotide nucleotidyltransferase
MASKKKADSENPTRGRQPRSKSPGSRAGSPRRGGKDAGERRPHAAPGAGAPAATPTTGKVVVEREIGGRTLSLETGRMAKLSDGACVARYGDTMVLAAVNSSKAPDGIDFFPLTVDYREKTAAAGVIPGGFFKREGRPTTKEVLACRLIDRSIRPMFPDGFRRDVQVLSQVLSTDRENDPDVVAAIASFAALALSSLPHGRSLGMVRIGFENDKLIVNPLWSTLQSEANKLNLTVAGHDEAIMMVEAGAKEVAEATMLEALELAHEVVREIAGMIDELVAKAGKPKMAFTPPQVDQALIDAIEDEFGDELRAAPVTPGNKQTRSAAIKAVKERAAAKFHAPHTATETEAKAWNAKVAGILTDIVKDAERRSILDGTRADGRDHKTIRPITIEVGVLPRVHGSVLFTRGETQALGVVTLGGTDDQQIIDGLMPEPRKRFLLHYSFPPFSVGETKRVLAPGRREIGHGALAERGLEPVLPAKEAFPYTIRITSEILESNGSSSMATACAGTLAMMDAGVPIQQPVAGIAMGLVMEGKQYAILSDILGSEDGCGDMDFKVVGTGRGITALQMDIKCDGLTREILAEALDQAREGRLHILREMLKALRAPREQISPNAPRLESVQVPNEKIGLIIGPGGKNIRQLQEQFECKISIEDSGLCTITGVNAEKVMKCVEHIRAMTAEVELGTVYEGRVTAIKEFGAFVEILPGQEGLVHVSELSDSFIRTVTDVVRIGDTLKVKVIAIDDFGKVKLSRKAVLLAERGETAGPAEAVPAERGERGPRGERGERREHAPRRDDFERGERPDRAPRPERRERFDRPERSDRFDRPERGERFDRGERSERPERSERTERPERSERPERTERPERSERPERTERPDRGERGERVERTERPERFDRGERPERGERPSRGERFDSPRGDEGRAPRGAAPYRPAREERGERHEEPRHGRPPREEGARDDRRDRFDRGPRAPRPEADAPARFEAEEVVDRPDRGPRAGGLDRERDRDRHGRPDRTRDQGRERGEGPVHGRPAADRAPRPEREERDRGRGELRGPRQRAPLPMSEFGDQDDELEGPVAAKPAGRPVGELESIDSLLGEDSPQDRGGRPRGGRRRR